MPDVTLERWEERHREAFARLHGEAEVMADLGGPFDRAASDAKFDRYGAAWAETGTSRWAVADAGGTFLGYAGIMLAGGPEHPLGRHLEIGWRFHRSVWGQGYAAASARQALERAWDHGAAPEILAYTAPDNLRSQRVMQRLGLIRDPARDFTARYPRGDWTGLVWVARHSDPATATP